MPDSKWLWLLNSDPTVARYTLDIFEHSPYFAEELIRSPELMEELSRLPTGKENPYAEAVHQAEDISGLRRFFRREMFRIQAASMCLRVPVFDTLEITSDLADAAIAASYRMAVEQVVSAQPPAASYQPRQQLMVMALGRLGMREFDLASDADLVVRPSRRGSRRAHILDARGRAHHRPHYRLHRSRLDVRRRHTPAAQWKRGRAAAVRAVLQRIFRQATPRPGKASPT